MKYGEFHIDHRILKAVDIMNTINGGMSQAVTRLEKMDKNYMLIVKMPGITPGNLVIEVKNNTINIYHKVSVQKSELYGGSGFFQFMVGQMVIPFDVNILRIKAVYDEHVLRIILPFNEFSNGYSKQINVDES